MMQLKSAKGKYLPALPEPQRLQPPDEDRVQQMPGKFGEIHEDIYDEFLWTPPTHERRRWLQTCASA